MLTKHAVLRRINVHNSHVLQDRSRANIFFHSLLTANFKGLGAQRLRTQGRSYRAPRLMILAYKVLTRRRRALKLLIVHNKDSKGRQAQPSAIHKGRNLHGVD